MTTIENINRLALGIMDHKNCDHLTANKYLDTLTLELACGAEICDSIPLQAALITAVNTGKRAFYGGINVSLPENTPARIPWHGKLTLNEIVNELGGKLVMAHPIGKLTLVFGRESAPDANEVQVVCTDWLAGIWTDDKPCPFQTGGILPTAGIFAGAYGVFLAFLKASGLYMAACDTTKGLSLWRPDLDWLSDEAKGIKPEFLPGKFWVLGLGHLGQSYLWNIGLLPYPEDQNPYILLQDFDMIEPANWTAGLITEHVNIGNYKTRLCSRWLENRGFSTKITERLFDHTTVRQGEEPFVGLCGFDNAASRVHLENVGFDLVAECGLGHDIATFDLISIHTFPNATKTAAEIWGNIDESKPQVNERVYELLRKEDKNECGILPLTLAGKAVSASFIGACSGALVMAELIRGLNGGLRYEKISLQLRALDDRSSKPHSSGNYTTEHSRNGFVEI